MQRINTRGSLLGRSLINSIQARSTTPLIVLLFYTNSTVKDYYRFLDFLNYTLVHMQPDVLKAKSFRFQNFCDTYWLSKILFKNMSVLNHFQLCAF